MVDCFDNAKRNIFLHVFWNIYMNLGDARKTWKPPLSWHTRAGFKSSIGIKQQTYKPSKQPALEIHSTSVKMIAPVFLCYRHFREKMP